MLLKNIINKVKIKLNNLKLCLKKKVKYSNNYIIFYIWLKNNIVINYFFRNYLYVFNNFFSELFIFVIKCEKKYEKKIGTFKPDLEVTKRHFNYLVNPQWLLIFIMNLDISIYSITTKFDYEFVTQVILKYYKFLYYYIFFKVENYIELLVTHLETVDISGLKTLDRYYIDNIYLNNTTLFIKNLHYEFSCYSDCLDYDYLDLRILIFDFLIVPYHFLEEWFVVQLESWIILGRIIFVIHYSDQKIKTAHSNKVISLDNFTWPKW